MGRRVRTANSPLKRSLWIFSGNFNYHSMAHRRYAQCRAAKLARKITTRLSRINWIATGNISSIWSNDYYKVSTENNLFLKTRMTLVTCRDFFNIVYDTKLHYHVTFEEIARKNYFSVFYHIVELWCVTY